MKLRLLMLLITLRLTTVNAQIIMRQRSTAEGLNIGAFGQFASWSTTSDDFSALSNSSSGGGGGLRLGYGFTQRLETYLRADYSVLSNSILTATKTNMTHVDVGLRFNFGSTIKRFRPFAELAASSVRAVIDPIPVNNQKYQLGLKGYGLTGGVGFNFFLSPALALNLEYKGVLIGQFSKTVDFGYSGESTSSETLPNGAILIGTGRASAGVNYYLKGRR